MFGINKIKNYKKGFNLLYAQNRKLDGWDRLYVWLSGTCRVIIIMTLLFILFSFGYRFILERNQNDLKDNLSTLGFRLKSYETRQTEITNVQNEITTYNNIWKQFSNFSPSIDDIVAIIPKDISQMSFTSNLVGITLSGTGLMTRVSEIENSYKGSPLFIDLVLSNLKQAQNGSLQSSASTNGLLSFSLQGNYAKRLQRGSLFLADQMTSSLSNPISLLVGKSNKL